MITIPFTLAAVGSATLWDFRTRRIPNLITLPAMALGIIINTYYSGLAGLGDAVAGMLLGIVILLIPFALGGMGAGDVKLLAAVGALNGCNFTVQTFLYSAVAGGAIAIIIALLQGRLFLVLVNITGFFGNLSISSLRSKEELIPFSTNLRFPYGIAILIGTLIAYWMRWPL